MRTRTAMISVIALLTAALALPATAQDDPGPAAPAQISVVHGVPEAVVDVYVDGGLALEDFEPGTVTDPIELPAGTYDLAVYLADADPAADDPVTAAEDVEVPAGVNASVVAHLTADGAPTLSVFVNDTSSVDHEIASVAVRHTAAAPAVDVLVDGAAAITELSNPDETVAELAEGTYEVAVVPAGGGADDAVIGPLDLTVPGDTLTIVYAVYALEDGSLTALTQSVPLGVDGPPAEPTREIGRVAGDSRIDTAIAVSQRAFPDGADVVYLARQDESADALAAGVLTDGPIMLVPNCGQLPAQVGEEIDRLDPDEVLALGGELAVCDSLLEAAAS